MLSILTNTSIYKKVLRKFVYFTLTASIAFAFFLSETSIEANAQTVEEQVETLINSERQKQNLPALLHNDNLFQASADHNKLISNCEKSFGRTACFTHTVTLLGEASLLNRIKATGYNPQGVAENIAWGHTSAVNAVSAWMASSGHRTNILGNYKDIGCDYLCPYWTCDFGRSFTAGSSATPTLTPTISPTLAPTRMPTPTRTPTPTLTPTPTKFPSPTVMSPFNPTPEGKPWWCAYMPSFNLCQ